jgi:hypothetical protein
MADLIFSRSRQQVRGSGFAGLLGLFAGLCAIFAVFITLSDWHQETTQARWPVLSAVVDRADVVASVRAPKHGGGTEWKLRYRLRYELNGEARMATLTSRAVFSETEAAKLQSWAAQHRKGSQIDIRYDASQDNRAVFASAEISYGAGRTGTDIIVRGCRRRVRRPAGARKIFESARGSHCAGCQLQRCFRRRAGGGYRLCRRRPNAGGLHHPCCDPCRSIYG